MRKLLVIGTLTEEIPGVILRDRVRGNGVEGDVPGLRNRVGRHIGQMGSNAGGGYLRVGLPSVSTGIFQHGLGITALYRVLTSQDYGSERSGIGGREGKAYLEDYRLLTAGVLVY